MMPEYSDYEIAQERINAREKNKTTFYIWIILFGIIFIIGLAIGGRGAAIFWPVDGLIGILVAGKGIQLYYESPSRKPSDRLTQLEMNWLFGDNWQADTGIREYVFAQDRIRKRSIARWVFLFHTFIFLAISSFFLIIFSSYKQTGEPGGEWWLLVPFIWLLFYIRHGLLVFPSRRRLEKRERKLGQTLQHELYAMYPVAPKEKEKLKRGKYYQVGDDGELEEVEDEVMRLDEKPKRGMGSDG